MQQALVLIDIQNDYLPTGQYPVPGSVEAAKNAALLLAEFRQRHLRVYHVQHVSPDPNAAFFRAGTPGVRIMPCVQPQQGEPVIVKQTPNSFFGTGLAALLEEDGVSDIAVSGMMTQMCVDTTVRAARDHRLSVTLIEDACAAADLIWNGCRIPSAEVQAVYMAALSGSFARVLTLEKWRQSEF